MMMEFNQFFHMSRVLTSVGWLENRVVTVDNAGRIESIMPAESPCTNAYHLLPALIDTHIHGAMGADVMDATHEALNKISLFLATKGVGAFLATTVTQSHQHIEDALLQIKKSYKQGLDGAELLGGYLEGPFFTAKNRGAHPEALLHAPDDKLLDRWLMIAEGSLKCVALAPEYPGSEILIEKLRRLGIRVMLGHTNADYQTTQNALLAGANGVVHCFNGMSGLHHREPGVVGAALTTPNCQVEIIADGYHVHPAALNIAYACAQQNLILISDAMRATGMPNGDYYLGQLLVHMQDNIVKTDSGSLAGSTLTLDRAVKKLAESVNIGFTESWLHGSTYPAIALGIDDELGSISVGKRANFVVLDENRNLVSTIVKGKPVFNAFVPKQ